MKEIKNHVSYCGKEMYSVFFKFYNDVDRIYCPVYSSFCGVYPLRMLAIIMGMHTLSTAARKRLTIVALNHVRNFFIHDILGLPDPNLPSTLPCRISHIVGCSLLYVRNIPAYQLLLKETASCLYPSFPGP